MHNTVNGSCGLAAGDCGVGEVGGMSSPAINMTGASCAKSSGGYEFMFVFRYQLERMLD